VTGIFTPKALQAKGTLPDRMDTTSGASEKDELKDDYELQESR